MSEPISTSTPVATTSTTSNSSTNPPVSSTSNNGAKANNPAPTTKTGEQNSSTVQAEKKAEEARRLKFRLKIDGKEEDYEADEHEVAAQLQKVKAADKRFQEANKLKQQLMRDIARGQQDPEQAVAIFKQMFGHDFHELAEKMLARKYEESTLSPEEKERREIQRRAEEAEKKLKDYETREKQAKQRAEEDKLWSEMEKEIKGALDEIGYEKDPALLTMIADIGESAAQMGLNLNTKQIVSEVNRRLEANTRHVLKRYIAPGRGKDLLGFLGPDAVKAVINAELERRKFATPGVQQETAPTEQTQARTISRSEPAERDFEAIRKRRLQTKEEMRKMKFGLE